MSRIIMIGMPRIDETIGFNGVKKMKFFHHHKGWYVLRWINKEDAINVAECMSRACSNSNLIFDIEHYNEILSHKINTDVPAGCCAPSLVRECIIEGIGVDPGEFFTWSEIEVLSKTELFEPVFEFISEEKTPLEIGDIIVTQTSGTTGIVIEEWNCL